MTTRFREKLDPKIRDRSVRERRPEPATTQTGPVRSYAASVSELQSAAGNRTVSRLLAGSGSQHETGPHGAAPLQIQRRGPKSTGEDKEVKPKAKGMSGLTRALDKKVASLAPRWDGKSNAESDEVRGLAKPIYDQDPGYYVSLLVYQLVKTRTNPKARLLYSLGSVRESHRAVFKAAWDKGDGELVAFLASGEWSDNPAGLMKLGRENPAFFIDHVLLDGFRRSDAGKQALQQLVEEKQFINDLAAGAAAAYARLVAHVPVLKLVKGVESQVETAKSKGVKMTQAAVIDKLFESFIGNRGMEVAYSGTKIDENNVILSGQTEQDKTARAEKLKPIGMDVSAKLSTACHQLLALFHSVLKSYPGLEGIDVKPGDEPMAVLTERLAALPGGLIAANYGGNVFASDGTPTGQIFFSGNQDKLPKSHSWVILDGVAYDPVLGTKGEAVEGAIEGRFEFLNGPDVATEVGGGRTLTKDRTLKTSGAYGINTCWRLTGKKA